MNKAFVTIIGASALAVSTAGFAGGPSTDTSPVPADNSAGFYVNGNIGYGHVDLNYDKNSTAAKLLNLKVDRNSFAWSANVGYQFNPYIAVEAGYMALPYTKVTITNPTTQKKSSTDLNTNAYTLVAKGILPINEQFDIFGKAGVALETHSAKSKTTIDGQDVTVVVRNNKDKITPLFGLGVDYNITQNWAVGLQGITTLKNGKDYPATYTGLVGVTYKFS